MMSKKSVPKSCASIRSTYENNSRLSSLSLLKCDVRQPFGKKLVVEEKTLLINGFFFVDRGVVEDIGHVTAIHVGLVSHHIIQALRVL